MKLRIDKLSFSRDQLKIIDNISYEFATAQVTMLTGPSGCGKTTFLRLLAGLETPDSGEILANETRWSSPQKIVPPWQRNLDMLFQGDALWPNQTVSQQIDWVRSRTQTTPADWNIDEIIEELGIKELLNRYPAGLSGGESRRCQLARILAGNPSVLLLDEPLSGQDAKSAAKTAQLLATLLKTAKITTIVVSHETALFSDFAWQTLYLPDMSHENKRNFT
ncbi:MAG: ATP-binding cassette domain-containing protein [Candidatus Riflebacteria bacterium]|nr:ATP-binding cassette domain-containing protein [Candidatus Riflebacteria bacterium]